MWTTSIPADVCKLDYPLKSQNERAECLIGMMKISKNKSTPGCKLHLISQRNGKLNAYINKTVVWILKYYIECTTYYNNVDFYVEYGLNFVLSVTRAISMLK